MTISTTKEDVIIKANGHDLTGKYSTSSSKHWLTCSICGEKINEELHGWECFTEGDNHWQTCSVCGTTTQVTEHTPNIAQATATQDKYCVLCNYVIEKVITTVKPGDVNGDGKVSAKDAKYLLGYSSFPSKYPIDDKQNVDYNNDGYEDADDVDYLLMYLFMPSQYPLYPGK